MIYEAKEDGRVRCGARLTEHLRPHSPGLFTAEGCQYYVLVKPKNAKGVWMHPEHGHVDLCNIHPTGEVRWDVLPCEARWISAPDREAVEHFGVHPAKKTAEEWKSELEESSVKWEDLSEVEQKTLGWLHNGNHVSIVKDMYFTNGNGERIDIVRNSAESSALHDLIQKGLAVGDGSYSGPGWNELSHIYKTTVSGKITRLGKKLLKDSEA